MKREMIRHVALPMIAPMLIVCLYFTPKDVFGCANRGLMALGIALAAAVASVAALRKSRTAKREGDKEGSNRWLLTHLILLLPLVLLAGPLG